MKPRFHPDELYRLRNLIPIDWLIQHVLKLRVHASNGNLRFQCPDCQQFNTAANPTTNLARCFNCMRNFNTIDLVIQIRQLPFVDAVKFLQAAYSPFPKHQTLSPHTAPMLTRSSSAPRRTNTHSELTAVRNILAQHGIKNS